MPRLGLFWAFVAMLALPAVVQAQFTCKTNGAINIVRITTAGSVTGGCFGLTFTTVAGITNYQVECSSNLLSTNWVCVGNPVIAFAGTQEFVDSSPVAAQRFYRIEGLGLDTTPPGNVTDFSAKAGNGQCMLSWINPSDTDFAGVRIQRKSGGYPTGISDGTTIYNGNGTNTTDTGVTNGTACYYEAFSYDRSTNYASGATATATPRDGLPTGNPIID